MEAEPPVATSEDAIRGPRAWADETWLAPNLASPDLLSLFSQPALWPLARSRVNVVQLYAPQILATADVCPQCGNNLKQPLLDVAAYPKLRGFGIDLAMEVGLIKAEVSPPCQTANNIRLVTDAVSFVKAAGGALSRITLDEPFYGAVRTDVVPGCRFAPHIAAQTIAGSIVAMRDRIRETAHQEVQIGIVEPYPAVPVAQLATYLDHLVQLGARPAYFHLDVDDTVLPPSWLADLRALRQHAANLGIPFGVLYGPIVAGSSEVFYAGTLQQVDRYTSLGRQEHAVFQSFALTAAVTGAPQIYPVNLPDNVPGVFSLTRLVVEGTNRLSAALPPWNRPTPVVGVAATFSDAAGFWVPTTGDTLLIGDVDGDGRDDVTARGHAGLFTQRSLGTTFAPGAQVSSQFSDAQGWNAAARAASLRLADANHDGQLDVVGYDPDRGLVVALGAPGPRFDSVLVLPIFGAGNDPGSLGWADVTGDGLGDFIMRGPSGLLVAPAIGRGAYGPARPATADFSPAGGWTAARYARIAYADVNQDGCADVTARGGLGAYVALSACSAVAFRPAVLVTDFFSDAMGFGDARYASSLQLGDVNLDGCADLVMRGGAGAWAKVGDCAGNYPFPPQLIAPFFSDAVGFDAGIYRDTFRLGDPAGIGRAAAVQRGGAGVYAVY